MTVFVIPNMTRQNTPAVTIRVLGELASLGCTVYLDSAALQSFSDISGVMFMPSDEAAKKCDVIIAIGGDGSFIYAAKYAVKYKKPLLGVNAGNLAFMAGLEGDEVELLRHLIDGKYRVDKRMILSVTLNDNDGKELYSSWCLNDAVIIRGGNLHLLKLSLYRNSVKLNDYNADGIVIATPTGSTAYSLSAGGPIIEPAVESIVITPVCSHSIMSRSVVVRDDSEITITVPSVGSGAILSCDSIEAVNLTDGCTVTVKKADFTCDLIIIKENSYFDILKDKFSGRTL